MNYLDAKVAGIESSEGINIVEFEVNDDLMYMLSLDTPNVKKGTQVILSIKPMSVAIAKRFSGSFSFSNRLFATVKSVDKGELMCSVKLDYKKTELEAVMSKRAIHNMHLRVGDTVVLFIKASDVFIKEII